MDRLPRSTTEENAPKMEVEHKYLLASEGDAERLEERLSQIFPDSRLIGAWSETSYYFPRVDKEKARQLLNLIVRHRPEEAPALLARLDRIPEDMPIAMRLKERRNPNLDGSFILIFKASANPLHDTERIEIETDDISPKYIEGFAANGVEPESIWHSVRREYVIDKNTKIDVQNVSGYGWTAEVEASDLAQVNAVAGKLGLQPLSKVSLDAMYKQYGRNWRSYYSGEGNDRHFSEDDWREIELASKESVVRNQIN